MRNIVRRLVPAILLVVARTAIAVPGDVLYHESFTSGTPAGWVMATGDGSTGVGEFPPGSGQFSLFTCCGSVELQSPPIDTGVPGAQVSITLQRGGNAIGSNKPEGNEDLDVYFLDDAGNWDFIARLEADGAAGQMINEVFVLEPRFLHAGFRIQLDQRDGNGSGDYWHLHDVAIIEAGSSGGLGTLCDSFDSGLGRWSLTSYGGAAAITTQTAGTGTESLALFGGSSRIISLPLDLADAANATLTLWVRRGDDTFSEDPDGGEDLAIGYIDSAGNYRQLDQLAGSGTPGQVFDLSYVLPADALHDALQVRIDLYDGNGGNNDYWHIDDVCVDAVRPLHHFAFAHDGSGVNCQAEPVRVVAHDNNHFVVENYTGTVALNTDTAHGDWSVLDGAGTITNNGSGNAIYAFSGNDKGDAILGLRNTFVESANINAIAGSATEDPGEDDSLAFARAGFNFLVDGNPLPLGSQIAGKPGNVAPGASLIELQAIRTDTDTGACEAALAGNVNIGVGFTCEDPASCAGAALTVNGVAMTGSPSGGPASYRDVGMDFGDTVDTTAPVVFHYADAGKIRLHARYQTGPSSEAMTGSSEAFVVRPFGFDVNATGNPAATSATGTVFAGAGEDFTINVRAVGWQAEDDIDGNGIPDGDGNDDASDNADLSDNILLRNFGNETGTDTAALSARLWQPAGGSNAGLSGTTAIGFSNGIGSGTVQYDEVGIVEISARLLDGAYFDTGDVHSRSRPIGRFTPHHFDVFIDAHGCNDAKAFTYSGQPIQALRVVARDADGDTTVNFDGAAGFAKDVFITETSGATGDVLNGGIAAGDFAGGAVTVTAAPSGVGFRFDTRESAPASIVLRATDDDGISSSGYTEAATEVRSARFTIDDANAVLLAQAVAALAVQRHDGTQWVTENDDTCTSINPGSFQLDAFTGDLSPGETGVVTDPSLTFLASGVGQVMLTPPGFGNAGSARLTYNMPAWMQYDWNGNGDEDDAATITFFDIHRTEDGLIDRVEVIH